MGYGYAIFQDHWRQMENSSTINPLVYIFNAEVVGTLYRLQAAIDCFPYTPQYWLYINSMLVI